jgi:hypothetical protein
MDREIAAWPVAAALLVGMLVCLELGRYLGARRLARDPQGAMSGLGVTQGAMFSLYGLLLAFSFSGAAARYDARKHLIVDESNAIGTAYLRIDLLPVESQPGLRAQFRNYVDSRLAVYRSFSDIDALKLEISRSEKLQKAIWAQVVAASANRGGHPEAGKLLLPALNEMIDITATRMMAARMHPPTIIYGLLFILALICSVLAGYGMSASRKRSALHTIAFAFITVVSVYVILDLEYPRSGLIRIDAFDQVLMDVRSSMN